MQRGSDGWLRLHRDNVLLGQECSFLCHRWATGAGVLVKMSCTAVEEGVPGAAERLLLLLCLRIRHGTASEHHLDILSRRFLLLLHRPDRCPLLEQFKFENDVELEPLENGSNSEGVELQKLNTWQLLKTVQRRACKTLKMHFVNR